MIDQEFRALFDSVSNSGRFETNPERGALNHLTPERVVAAARLVRTGESGWEFLLVAAPLRVARGTGSPLNPIAIF